MSLHHSISVAVIGGGLAGIAAAERLHEVGLDPFVFDRGVRAGGRCATRRATPFSFDHGAQYFTVRDRVFRAFVERWQPRGWVAPWNGTIVRWQDGRALTEEHAPKRWVAVPSMRALPEHLVRAWPNPDRYRSGCTVARMQRVGIAWRLFDEAGRELGDFERVLIAMPPQQALRLLPVSSPLVGLIETLDMRPCWAGMFGWDQPLPLPFDGAFVDAGPLRWVARNSSKPGRPEPEAWVLHAEPEWSAQRLHRSPTEIAHDLRIAFEELLGTSLPEPAFQDAHRWSLSIPRDTQTQRIWMDRASGIALAGDAYLGGRVEGAFLSGRLAAEVLVGAADRGASARRPPLPPE